MQELSSAGLSASLTNLAIPDAEQCLTQQVHVLVHAHLYVYIRVTSRHSSSAITSTCIHTQLNFHIPLWLQI